MQPENKNWTRLYSFAVGFSILRPYTHCRVTVISSSKCSMGFIDKLPSSHSQQRIGKQNYNVCKQDQVIEPVARFSV
jgi:hypothetical protein